MPDRITINYTGHIVRGVAERNEFRTESPRSNQSRQAIGNVRVCTHPNASTFKHIGDMQILESSFRLADAKSLSHGKWGSTDGRRSNQEQMP